MARHLFPYKSRFPPELSQAAAGRPALACLPGESWPVVKCVGLETGFDRRPKTLGALFPTVERLSQAHVANSELKKRSRAPYTDKILQETYRLELIELIKGHTVLLCTVRKEMYRDITLRTIAQKCSGWQPHEAYFNSTDTWHGDIVKAKYLEKLIFPTYHQTNRNTMPSSLPRELVACTNGTHCRFGREADELDALALLCQVKQQGLAEWQRLQLFASHDDGRRHILARHFDVRIRRRGFDY